MVVANLGRYIFVLIKVLAGRLCLESSLVLFFANEFVGCFVLLFNGSCEEDHEAC